MGSSQRTVLAVGAGLVAAALAASVWTLTGSATTTASKVIGPEGGGIWLEGGALDGAALWLPAHACPGPTTVTLSRGEAPVPAFVPAGPSIRVEARTAAGPLCFAEDATMTIPFFPALVPAGQTPSCLQVVFRDAGSHTTFMPVVNVSASDDPRRPGTLAFRVPMGGTATAVATPTIAQTVSFGATPDARMDVFLPPVGSPKPRAAILAIHGGAWLAGDKYDTYPFAALLCPRGYVVFTPNYRLASAGAHWPAQLDDCRAALAYVRAHAAEWNVDPNRIASLGVSAGAHLALMLGFRPFPETPPVKAVVDIAGPTDFTFVSTEKYVPSLTAIYGHGSPWSPEELRDISPRTFVRPGVPVLIVHGENDDDVFVRNSDELARDLERLKSDVVYKRFTGEHSHEHGFVWSPPEATNEILAFLAARL